MIFIFLDRYWSQNTIIGLSSFFSSFWNLKEQVSCTGLWIVLLALKFYQVLLYLLFLLLLSCGFYCLHNDICFVGFSFWICSSSWIIFVSPKSSSFNIYLCYLCLHHPIVIMCSFYPLIFLNFSFMLLSFGQLCCLHSFSLFSYITNFVPMPYVVIYENTVVVVTSCNDTPDFWL